MMNRLGPSYLKMEIEFATAGAAFQDTRDRIASYKDLRLDPKFVSYVLPAHLPAIIGGRDIPSVGLFRSGFHHYYHFNKNR